MPTNKNTKLKSNSGMFANKKRLGILLAAFVVVGAVFLIRSFAATTVISFNPGDNLTTNNIAGFAQYGATTVSETVQDGKKSNTYNYAELSRPQSQMYSPSWVRYKSKLNEGFYMGCVRVKPVTAKASASLSVTLPSGAMAQGLSMLKNDPPAGWFTTPVAAGGFSEQCTNFVVSAANSGKDFDLWFNAQGDSENLPENKWRVSEISIKLASRQELSPGVLMNASSAALKDLAVRGNSGSGSVFYDQPEDRTGSTQVSFYGTGTGGTVVGDTVNGISQQVLNVKKEGRVMVDTQFINSANNATGSTSAPDPIKTSNKTYKACFVAKAAAGVTGGIELDTFTKGVAASEPAQAVTGNGTYQTFCRPRVGIRAGERLQFTFVTGASSWSIADAWIE